MEEKWCNKDVTVYEVGLDFGVGNMYQEKAMQVRKIMSNHGELSLH